jgi:hypothetical protein
LVLEVVGKIDFVVVPHSHPFEAHLQAMAKLLEVLEWLEVAFTWLIVFGQITAMRCLISFVLLLV